VAPAYANASLRIEAPAPGELLPLARPGGYEVRLAESGVWAGSDGIDLSLDGGRPRRVSATRATVTLGELAASDDALGPGAHWLFAGPVSAGGLVPRPSPHAPPVAVARRFFIGGPSADAGTQTGATWLRKPEGTYNGPKQAAQILFDACAFSPSGDLLDVPLVFTLRGPGVTGELALPAPFVVKNVPSGDYEVRVSGPSLPAASLRFTVNREIGGAP